MAPKTKSRLVDQPPSASSSEEQEQVEESQEEGEEEQSGEEEEGEGESGEETEEDEEPKIAPPVEKRPIIQKPIQTPQKPQSSSESGSEDGSGSESESGHSLPSPSASDFTVKPIFPAKAAAPSKPAAKRPQETQKDKGRKKPKIAEEEEKKAAATPRSLWSDEDQLALLKGITEYKAQKGMEPSADMSAFHEFIKGKLQAEVSKSQLSDKLRRLKKKFLTNMNDGEEPVFAKGQDFLVFQHSKKIWGAPGTSNGGVKENVTNSTNGKAKKTVEVNKSSEPKRSAKVSKPKDDEKHKEEEKQVAVKEVVKEDIVKGDQQDFQSKYPRLAASFESMAGMSTMYPNGISFLKENTSLIASDKAKVLEEKWKKLEDDEAALLGKRLALIAEHYKSVIDATTGN